MALGLDITESKLKEAQVKGQLDAINKVTGLLEMKLDGTIIRVNDIYCELYGYEPKELIGRHHRIFVDEEFNLAWKEVSNFILHGLKYFKNNLKKRIKN